METADQTIRRLRGEIDTLKEQLVQAHEALRGPDVLALSLSKVAHLTGTEAIFCAMLLQRPMVTRDAGYTVIYGDRADAPEVKIMDVFACKLRRKLSFLEIEIETVWGRGWLMNESQKSKLRALLPTQTIVMAAA